MSGGRAIGLRVCLLGSGSGGNCGYIGISSGGNGAGEGILIDAGLSAGDVLFRLRSIRVDIREIKGILITHEHQDHVYGADSLALKYGVPIYSNSGTRRAAGNLRKLPFAVRLFETGTPFSVGPFQITPFPISHDAADPVGFSIQTDCNGNSPWYKIGMVTDLGCLTPSLGALRESDVLILESNYDVEMLENGPYPAHLKKRVSGSRGHLSNTDSANLLKELLHPKLQHLVLAHLSRKNNLPQLAYELAHNILKRGETTTRLHLAWQDFISPVVTLP